MANKRTAPDKKLIYGWGDDLNYKLSVIAEHYIKVGVNIAPTQKSRRVSDSAVIRQLINDRFEALEEEKRNEKNV